MQVGKEGLYQNAVPPSQLIEMYPGMFVAWPEVFQYPQESLLYPEDKLLPGQKYYIVPSTIVQKLKQKHPKKAEAKELVGSQRRPSPKWIMRKHCCYL